MWSTRGLEKENVKYLWFLTICKRKNGIKQFSNIKMVSDNLWIHTDDLQKFNLNAWHAYSRWTAS